MITCFQIWKARNRGRKINTQHKKFEYDKESHKKFIYKKTMVLYIKIMKYTKNDEHAKNLHDNMRKMMSMKIISMRKMNRKIREERLARKESTRERWTLEYEK